MSTRQTIALLRAVASATLRPMTRSDHHAFADAENDAQIGEIDSTALLEITDTVVAEEGSAPLVVVSGDTIEVHWYTEAGYTHHCVALRAEVLL
jgi:hypothetical protein